MSRRAFNERVKHKALRKGTLPIAPRDGRCQICHAAKPLTRHHRKRKCEGGILTKANTQFLCRNCHTKQEVRIDANKRGG